MADLVVKSRACTVYLASGAVSLLYEGAALPAASDLAEGEAKRLTDGGFVGPAEAASSEPKKKSGK